MKNEKVKHVEDRPARGETRAESRPERIPLNGEFDTLKVVGIREGYHPCWVNERNVPRFTAAGYTFVDYPVSFGSYHVSQGNPLGARYARDVGHTTAYLMEIPQDLYDADYAAMQERVAESESGIVRKARGAGLDHGDIVFNNAMNRGK